MAELIPAAEDWDGTPSILTLMVGVMTLELLSEMSDEPALLAAP